MSNQDPPAIQGSIFEGLFVSGPANDPALHEKLRPLGFDAQRLEPTYPPAVLESCIVAACRHLWPTLPEAQGRRRLGALATEGFQRTLLGSIATAALRLLGPERLIKQLPRRIFSGQNYGSSRVEEVAPRHWQLHYRGVPVGLEANAEFVCGALEAALAAAGVPRNSATLATSLPDGFVLDLRWDE